MAFIKKLAPLATFGLAGALMNKNKKNKSEASTPPSMITEGYEGRSMINKSIY